MKEKFEFIFSKVTKAMTLLDEKKITVEQAKAMASLAKQANNTISTQVDTAKFISNNTNHKESLEKVGL